MAPTCRIPLAREVWCAHLPLSTGFRDAPATAMTGTAVRKHATLEMTAEAAGDCRLLVAGAGAGPATFRGSVVTAVVVGNSNLGNGGTAGIKSGRIGSVPLRHGPDLRTRARRHAQDLGRDHGLLAVGATIWSCDGRRRRGRRRRPSLQLVLRPARLHGRRPHPRSRLGLRRRRRRPRLQRLMLEARCQ